MKRLVTLPSLMCLAVIGVASWPATVAGAANPAAGVKVSSVAARDLTAGESYDIKGKVTKAPKGTKVRLQGKFAGEWINIEATKTKKRGKYRIKARAAQSGRAVPHRLVVAKSAKTVQTRAPIGKFTIYGWHYVTDGFPWVEGDGSWRWTRGPFDINGGSYEKSFGAMLYYSGTRTNQINLGRKCTRFSFTAGLSDDSQTTHRVTTTTWVDAIESWKRSNVALGASWPVELDVTNALRLKFESTRTAGSGSGYMVWGNARLLCAL